MNYRRSFSSPTFDLSHLSLNPFLVSRPYPRFGLKENNYDSKYCIYAFFQPPQLPSRFVEHRISRSEFEV